MLDTVLRLLAIGTAESGLTRAAATLVTYTEANLRPYRLENPRQAWIQSRLDQLLAGLPEPATQPGPHRGEIMTLVNDLDTTITRDEPVVLSTTS